MMIPFDNGSKVPSDYCLEYVRKQMSKVMDWDLSRMTVLNYRVTDDHRLQVALMDHDVKRIEGTRGYMERLLPHIIEARLDILIIHTAP